MIAMIGPIIELIVKLLGWWMDNKAISEQNKRDYIAFLEIMDRFGIASVKMRLEATKQIDRVKEMWDEEDHKGTKDER